MPTSPVRPQYAHVRPVRTVGVISLAGLVAWLLIGLPIFVLNPGNPLPRHADAALVLGPVTPQRAAVAQALLRSGRVDRLLWSTPGDQRADVGLTAPCRSEARLTCFAPLPSTTQGEARMLRRETAVHGWHSVIVITMTPHLARARTIVARCFAGTITMRSSGEAPNGGWAYQYAYQTSATIKEWLHPGC